MAYKFKLKFRATCIQSYVESGNVYISSGQTYTVTTKDFGHYKVKSDVRKADGSRVILHIMPDFHPAPNFLSENFFNYFKLENPMQVPPEMLTPNCQQ